MHNALYKCYYLFKGEELGYDGDHLKGWWKGMRTWYVKLDTIKADGDGTKIYTDREKYLMDRCAFYKPQIRHRVDRPKAVSNILIFFSQ